MLPLLDLCSNLLLLPIPHQQADMTTTLTQKILSTQICWNSCSLPAYVAIMSPPHPPQEGVLDIAQKQSRTPPAGY